MQRLLKHKFLVALLAVLLLAGGGAAYAATQTGANPQQALLNDVAKRLNVSPSQLRSAVQGALLDRIEAAVKAGQLTQAQANRLKQRIAKGGLPLGIIGGGGMWRHGFGPRRGFGPGPGFAGPAVGPFAGAAKYLGISEKQLLSDLRGGKTLAQVAQAQGKSVSGLEQAIVSSETTRLDTLVSKGYLTKAQEQRRLSLITRAIDRLVEHAGIMAGPPGQTPMKPLRPGAVPPALFGSGQGGPPAGGPAGAGGLSGGPPPPAA
ncbi:MAG TPA: hypothetical protein VMD09_04500 [Solirubrobacteraceae bacterium]|nr:hypothetical protein [Solirubrobacteraceae bacterium]